MTSPRRVAVALLAALLVVLAAAPARAVADDGRQRQAQIGRQIDNLQDQVEEVSAEEAALVSQLAASQAKLDALNTAVQELDAKVAAAAGAVDAAQAKLTAAQDAQAAAASRLTTLTTELADARVELRRRAIDSYVGTDAAAVGAANAIDVGSVERAAATSGYTAIVVDLQQRAVTRFDSLRDEADTTARQLTAARDDAAKRRDALAADRTALQAQRDQQDAARLQAAGQAATQQALLVQVEASKAGIETQIATLESESQQIAATLKALSTAGSAPVPSGKGIFSLPIPGAPVTSGFGMRLDPVLNTVSLHAGVDFGAPEGAPIRAAADGKVIQAGQITGYGNATVIDHGRGLATLYGHQSVMLVTAGQQVKRGDVIGLVGHTGYATGPHLHFEVRANGTPVDPIPYL